MRDPDRLDDFYKKIRKPHQKYVPDWRFGQLMVNFMSEVGDPFYWEEDVFLDRFEKWVKKSFKRG